MPLSLACLGVFAALVVSAFSPVTCTASSVTKSLSHASRSSCAPLGWYIVSVGPSHSLELHASHGPWRAVSPGRLQATTTLLVRDNPR